MRTYYITMLLLCSYHELGSMQKALQEKLVTVQEPAVQKITKPKKKQKNKSKCNPARIIKFIGFAAVCVASYFAGKIVTDTQHTLISKCGQAGEKLEDNLELMGEIQNTTQAVGKDVVQGLKTVGTDLQAVAQACNLTQQKLDKLFCELCPKKVEDETTQDTVDQETDNVDNGGQ